MEDNIVYDNMLNTYISDTKYTTLQRNLIYCSSPSSPFYRDDQHGIGMGDELKNPSSSDNKIINNLVMGCSRNFYKWSEVGTGLVNVLIAHNTFVNSALDANFKITSAPHSNTRIENNIFLQEDSLSIADVANDPGLTFSHNLWSKTPPPHVSSANDVVDNPQLAKSGSTGPGQLTPEWFKILTSSPARDRAKVISEVTEDFFRNARGGSPDIGAHEYVGGTQPTPTPTPTSPTPSSTPTPFNPYDLDGDDKVNAADVLILLGNWRNGSRGDFNSDGKINNLDFGLLITNWGR